VAKSDSNSFSDFIKEQEDKATPERLKEMKRTKAYMKALHDETFGSTNEK